MPERFQCGCEMPEYTGGIFDEAIDDWVLPGPCPICKAVERINALAEAIAPLSTPKSPVRPPRHKMGWGYDLGWLLAISYIEAADIIMEEMG